MKHIEKFNRRHDQAKNVVRFEFHDPTASTVCIAGSFNEWKPEAGVDDGTVDGRWTFEKVLPYGDNEYQFVVDGRWVVDPSAADSVPNPFGGRNSVVIVPHPSPAEHNAAAEQLPLKNAYKRKHYGQN